MLQNSKWISWQDLTDQGFPEHELLDSIIKGDRKPFSRYTGKYMLCPREFNQSYLDLDKKNTWLIRDKNTKSPFPWGNFKLPHDKDKVKQLFKYLAEVVIFKEPDKGTQTVEKKSNFDQSVIKLMNEARTEIEAIYKAIKGGEEGFHSIGERHVARRMNDALNYFEEYKNKFEIIKKEDLQNKEIFETSNSQYARKIKGELLKAIVGRNGFGNHSHSKLFAEYQKQKTINS